MTGESIAIVGGGAAGFFAAITCAEENRSNEVSIFERGSEFLTKVRISGGGRCNVTHACLDPMTFASNYPRGDRPLISPLHRFSPADTVAWFDARGVKLKIEADGRMFPVTNSSRTIIDCLIAQAKAAGVKLFTRKGIERVRRVSEAGFELYSPTGTLRCDRVLLATGGTRATLGAQIAQSLGHTLLPPVPSLFSFHTSADWLRSLPGISIAGVEVSVPGTPLTERGPILVTHNGLSGPAILRLSAWGARILHEMDYRFVLCVNWMPELGEEKIRARFASLRRSHPNRQVRNSPLDTMPARLWEQLVTLAKIAPETRWTTLSTVQTNALIRLLRSSELSVHGKSLNKEEFVTCGGVNLREINFKTMESRVAPRLYFAGELLDLDGITGGFNFQAAWTTGWIAGQAMAGKKHATYNEAT